MLKQDLASIIFILMLNYRILKNSLTKMGGISNFQIEDAIKKIGDKDLSKNFVGVFPSNYMNKFINHAAMIEDKKGKYPFIIANTDSSEKKRLTLVDHT